MTSIPTHVSTDDVGATFTTSDNLILAKADYVISTVDDGLSLEGEAQFFQLNIAGFLQGVLDADFSGVHLVAESAAEIAIGRTGVIRGGSGLTLEGAFSLVNDGAIFGIDGDGVAASSVGDFTITNHGAITAQGIGSGINIDIDAAGKHKIENFGVITGYGEGHVAILSSSASAIDEVSNLGSIYGNISLGGGNDVVHSGQGLLFGTVDLGDGDDDFDGSALADTVDGGGGEDSLMGYLGDDALRGGDDDDYLDGGAGVDTMEGGGGNDTYIVDEVNDKIVEDGGITRDIVGTRISYHLTKGLQIDALYIENKASTTDFDLTGNEFGQQVDGNAGRNALDGGAGNDTVTGSYNADLLTGGDGRDFFQYVTVKDSGSSAKTRDIILDFKHDEDRIDLLAIDANESVVGNNAFTLSGKGSESSTIAAGTIGYYWEDHKNDALDKTIIQINNDSDAKIEMTIELTGLHLFTNADFIL